MMKGVNVVDDCRDDFIRCNEGLNTFMGLKNFFKLSNDRVVEHHLRIALTHVLAKFLVLFIKMNCATSFTIIDMSFSTFMIVMFVRHLCKIMSIFRPMSSYSLMMTLFIKLANNFFRFFLSIFLLHRFIMLKVKDLNTILFTRVFLLILISGKHWIFIDW